MSVIEGAGVTIEWLHETLEKATDSKSKLSKWEVGRVGVGQGYASKMYSVTFDWENRGKLPAAVVLKIKSVADNLAKLHAKSLSVDGFEKKFDMDRMRRTFESMMDTFTTAIEQQIKPQFPDFFKNVCESMMRKVDLKEGMAMVLDAAERNGVPNVLVHGDFWPNNMMFKKDNNGKPSDKLLAFIDLQIAHPGSCMEDLTKEKVWAAFRDIEPRSVFFTVIGIGIFTRMPELDKAGKGDREENLNVMLRRSQAAVHDYFPDLVKDVC